MNDFLRVSWLASSPQSHKESPPNITGHRRMEHSDIPQLEDLVSVETNNVFGDLNIGEIYEASCFSIVQSNEKDDVVSGMCVCNYPNVPSVPADDWLSWIKNIYGVEESVTEMNTLFVHFLVWDKRYEDSQFFGDLLAGLFELASYCLHVILVLPPRVILGELYHQKMTKIVAKGARPSSPVQSLYMTSRHLHNPTLSNRRLVEEDNDDVIPIIDAETTLLKELYGEYYISEMVRYPDGLRQLIVSENDEGTANGVMCLNRALDVDILNANFELIPYNGLRKPHKDDDVNSSRFLAASELFASVFPHVAPQSQEFRSSSLGDDQFFDDVYEGEYSGEEMILQSRSSQGFDVTSSRSESFAGEYEEDRSCQQIFMDDDSTVPPMESGSLRQHLGSTDNFSASKGDILGKETGSTPIDPTVQVSFHASLNISQMTFLNRVPSASDYLSLYYHSRAHIGHTLPQRTKRDTVKSLMEPPRLIYHGKANAFTLELFAARKEIADQFTLNFLEASFECFPDLDYCVVLIPNTHHHFSFLQHAVRVPLKCNKDFPRALYVTHRAALIGEIKVRRAKSKDEENVRDLLNGIPKSLNVFKDFAASVKKGSFLESYVFTCCEKLVGLAVLCEEEQTNYLKRRFHIEDYVVLKNVPWYAHKRILHFVLMPIFAIYHRNFLREIMRLSGGIVLYYRLYESDNSALTRTSPLITCLNTLIPMNPRRRIEYHFRGYEEADEILSDENFSLFLTNPRLTSIPFSIIDSRIVIIGPSDCGLGVAEQLTLGSLQQFIHFTNVTVISPHALPFEIKRSEEVLRMLPFRGRICQEYRHLIALRSCTNVVYGTAVAMNRRRKYVLIKDQGKISYDYLIVTCGLQYYKPMFEEEIHEKNTGHMIPFEKPWNCLTVNNDSDAYDSLEQVQYIMMDDQKKSIVFYGHNIDCYCALHGLLEFGVPGSQIILIEPPLGQCDKHDDIFFNDCEVDTEIMKAIVKKGVTFHYGYSLIDWVLTSSENGKEIDSLIFETKGQRKRIPCNALFYFYEKQINTEIFLAICRTGLVFDGRLIIDPECRTNDPHVFAAGTITKYSRKFMADSWQHKYYNSFEIGQRLAENLRTIIDIDQAPPVGRDSTASERKNYPLLPTYRTPIIISCTLPGGNHYLHVRKAGKKVFRNVAIKHNAYGQVLITGSCQSEIGYFRIRLNTHDTVETVTCLSRKSFEVHHMIAIYGKHESLLNELKLHFRNSLIVDFFAYFREPWATALFYDKFACFRVENRATLLSKLTTEGDSLMEDCIYALNKSNWEAMSQEDRRLIQEKFPGSVYHLGLEEGLIDFLECFEEDLPMYCTPEKMRTMYADNENSPLFN